ncbi:hypothetical protein COOONC_13009 [Cooperia oncophora]
MSRPPVFATEGRRSSSRQRRPASATPAEPSPSRTRTRKGSDSIHPVAPETPKSPGRRGRSHKIQTIPE